MYTLLYSLYICKNISHNLLYAYVVYMISHLFCFSFPSCPIRRLQWAKATRRVDPITKDVWEPGPGASLCSLHFSQESYDCNGKLYSTAVPSIFSFTPKCKVRLSRNSLAALQPIVPPVFENEEVSSASVKYLVDLDHNYCLPAADVLKKRLSYMMDQLDNQENQLQQVKKDFINSGRREKRLRVGMTDLLDELKKKNLLNAHQESLLQRFKGKLSLSLNTSTIILIVIDLFLLSLK